MDRPYIKLPRYLPTLPSIPTIIFSLPRPPTSPKQVRTCKPEPIPYVPALVEPNTPFEFKEAPLNSVHLVRLQELRREIDGLVNRSQAELISSAEARAKAMAQKVDQEIPGTAAPKSGPEGPQSVDEQRGKEFAFNFVDNPPKTDGGPALARQPTFGQVGQPAFKSPPPDQVRPQFDFNDAQSQFDTPQRHAVGHEPVSNPFPPAPTSAFPTAPPQFPKFPVSGQRPPSAFPASSQAPSYPSTQPAFSTSHYYSSTPPVSHVPSFTTGQSATYQTVRTPGYNPRSENPTYPPGQSASYSSGQMPARDPARTSSGPSHSRADERDAVIRETDVVKVEATMDITSICKSIETHRALKSATLPQEVQGAVIELVGKILNTRQQPQDLIHCWTSLRPEQHPNYSKLLTEECLEFFLACATSLVSGPDLAYSLVDCIIECSKVTPSLQEALHLEVLVRNESLIPIWPQTEILAESRMRCKDIPGMMPSDCEELLAKSLQNYRALGWLIAAIYRHPRSKYDLSWALRWIGYANSAPVGLTDRAYLPTLVGFLHVCAAPLSKAYPSQFFDAFEYLRSSLFPQLRSRYSVLESYQPCLVELEKLLNDEVYDPLAK